MKKKESHGPSTAEIKMRAELDRLRRQNDKLKQREPDAKEPPHDLPAAAGATSAQLEEADRTRQRLSKLYFGQVEENRRRLERQHHVLECISRLSAERDLDALVAQLAAAARVHIGFGWARGWLLDRERGQLVSRVSAGAAPARPGPYDVDVVPPSEFDAWLEAGERTSQCACVGRPPAGSSPPAEGDPAADERWEWHPDERLLVPVRTGRGVMVAALALAAPASGVAPSRDEVELLELLAHHAAIAIDNAVLVAALARHGEELEAWNRRTHELLALRSAFLTSVSRELRAALTAIRAYADGLRGVQEGDLPFAQVRGFLGTVHDESQRLARLSESMLDLSRFDPGQSRHARSRFDLADLVEEALARLKPLAAAGQVALKMQIAVADTCMEADREQVLQLVQHLARNGLSTTSPGGSVTFRLSGDVRDLMLDITDNGVGIPEPQLETLFERSHPFDVVAARDADGSGLGLAICRSIVEAHGGRIWAESEPGEGSHFTVVLPRRSGARVTLNGGPDGDSSLSLGLEMVSEILGAGLVLLYAPDDAGRLVPRAATGVDDARLATLALEPGQGVAGWVANHRRAACASGPDAPPDDDPAAVGRYLAVPLEAERGLIGVLCAGDPTDGRWFTADDARLLVELAHRVAETWVAAHPDDGATSAPSPSRRALRRALEHLERGRRSAPDRVRLARDLARALDLQDADVAAIAWAASLHQTAGAPGDGDPAAADAATANGPAAIGDDVLHPLDRLGAVRATLLALKEWWDGSGYPRGLAGERIPIGARILAVVDAWEHLIVGGANRAPLGPERALEELRRGRGIQFDPAVVDALERVSSRTADSNEAAGAAVIRSAASDAGR